MKFTNLHLRLLLLLSLSAMMATLAYGQDNLEVDGRATINRNGETLRLNGVNNWLSFYNGSQYNGYLNHTNTDLTLMNRRQGALALGTNNSTRMTITDDGQVGIGINSPAVNNILHVTDGYMRFEPRFNNTGTGHISMALNFGLTPYLSFNDGTSETIALSATGNSRFVNSLALGNNSTGDYKLKITHDSETTSAHIELNETMADDFARIKFTNTGSAGSDYWDIAGRANGITNPGLTNSSSLNFYYENDGGLGLNYLEIRPNGGVSSPWAEFSFRGDLLPERDNFYRVGNASRRWITVYSVNGVSSTSDIRMKKNINELQYGLTELMDLNPVSYNWKDENYTEPQIGLIAQEVLKVIPEAVLATEKVLDPKTGKESIVEAEIFSMNYDKLIPVLIKSIQEQQKVIESLQTQDKNVDSDKRVIEQRVTDLEQKLTMLIIQMKSDK